MPKKLIGLVLYNTDCEISSDECCSNNIQYLNKEFKSTNILSTKRKKLLSNNSETNEPPKKIQKTIDVELLNLKPCSVALEPLNNLVNDEMNNIVKIKSENYNLISIINYEEVKDKVNISTENGGNNNENLVIVQQQKILFLILVELPL